MKSVDARSSGWSVAVGLVLGLIVYGSLYPFQWNFAAPQAFIWSGPIGLMDLIENIVLFVPLGGLLGWAGIERKRRWVFFALWWVLALVVASVLQWLQKYLPRTPALSDVVFNMVGFVLGWGAGVVARWRVGHLIGRHQGWEDVDRFTLVLIALWWGVGLYPLIPTLEVSSVAHNFKSLWQHALWQPRRMLLHAGMTLIGLAAIAHLARSAHLAHRARSLALLATGAVLVGKFVVVGQSPGMAVVLGIASGWVLWRSAEDLPADLIFSVDYLGGSMPTFALNFSRPAAQVIAQYYTLVRYGFEGYRSIQQRSRDIAGAIAKGVADLGLFTLLSRGEELPVLAFSVSAPNGWSVYDLSHELRSFGWIVPAYPMPEGMAEIDVLRVVVRNGFTFDLAGMFLADLGKSVERLNGKVPDKVAFHH